MVLDTPDHRVETETETPKRELVLSQSRIGFVILYQSFDDAKAFKPGPYRFIQVIGEF